MWKSRNRQVPWRQASLAAIAAALVLGLGVQPVASQEDEEAGKPPKASRAQLFDALAQDVVLLEKQSNVLKKVVKLVGPTVVRIDAEKADQFGLRTGRRSQVEEAGSGYVVKLGE